MKFSLRLETPVHTGNGEHLSWLDYSLVGREVRVLDWRGIVGAAAVGCDDVAERLAAFTDRSAKLIDDAQKALSKAPGRERSDLLRKTRDQTDPLRFIRDDLKNEVLERAVKNGDYDRYRAEFLGGRLDRRLEILAQAKDAAGKPTIPGSVLRGQIRTALLHHALSALDEATSRRIMEGGFGVDGWERSLRDATPGRARFLFGEDIEAAVFQPALGSSARRRVDPRLDVMRFLRVSDPVRSRTTLVVMRSSPFQFSKSRERGGGLRTLPLAPSVMEAIDEGSEFEYELTVDAALLRGVAAVTSGEHPFAKDEFWHAFSRLFGVSRAEAAELEPPEIERRVLSAVEVSLAARMTALAARERRWCERIGAPKEAPPRVLLDRLEKQSDRIPLRIGFGVGLHSLTALAALETDASLSESLGRVLARTGLGLAPRARRERAEREKAVIEKARREAFGGGGNLGLRDDLLNESRDPTQLPVSRRYTMAGGGPDELLGYASLAQGEMSAEAPVRRERVAEPSRPTGGDRGDRRDRGDRADRRDRGDRSDRRDRGDRRERERRERRPPVPDRPANQSEIEELLKRFGPRH